jgi:hypothetical protein
MNALFSTRRGPGAGRWKHGVGCRPSQKLLRPSHLNNLLTKDFHALRTPSKRDRRAMAGISHAAPAVNDAGRQLHDWFDQLVRLFDRSIFGAAEEGPHRDAIILNVLSRNARLVRESEVDRRGLLYTSACSMLAAACRRLRLELGPGHWATAVANVISLRNQARSASHELTMFGLDLGSPARMLKQQLDEALLHAGVAGVPTFVDSEGRRIALGLAINWGIRFLCAYALECENLEPLPGRRDLAWIAQLLRPIANAGASGVQAGH